MGDYYYDLYAPSNIRLAVLGPGRVADLAASRKRETYQDLSHNHHFVPVAVETTGSFGKDAIKFLYNLANHQISK